MILHELVGHNEDHPVYQALDVANREIQINFLNSLVLAALGSNTPFLSQTVIKALNFHSIGCLHAHAGQYRPCEVKVGEYHPPEHFRVATLMDDMVNRVNRNWTESESIELAAYVLWRINHIHPFINGNGRTARASSYFVLCLHMGKWIPGDPILPELLREDPYRSRYLEALKKADQDGGLAPLAYVIADGLLHQLSDPNIQ